MGVLEALGSGLVGACTVNLINEVARQFIPDAPRLDLLGQRALSRGAEAVGLEAPSGGAALYSAAMAGDIFSNTLYYSTVGLGSPEGAWARGAFLGLAAGIGAVALPGPMGLGNHPTARTPATQAMTVAWYLSGGLAAAAVYRLLANQHDGEQRPTEQRQLDYHDLPLQAQDEVEDYGDVDLEYVGG